MFSEPISRFIGLSGLSEDELSSLWGQISERWPKAFSALTGAPLDRDEGAGPDMVVHILIGEKYPTLSPYPEQYRIYSNMKEVRGWQRLRVIVDRNQILDESDYWTARNAPLAFSERLSGSQRRALERLLREYDQAT